MHTLWVVEVATGKRPRIISTDDVVQPAWSPRGHRIAYWGSRQNAQRDIWTMAADGSDARPVTDDTHLDWNPVWSPDGKYLYFASDRQGSMGLWRVPVDELSGDILGPARTGPDPGDLQSAPRALPQREAPDLRPDDQAQEPLPGGVRPGAGCRLGHGGRRDARLSLGVGRLAFAGRAMGASSARAGRSRRISTLRDGTATGGR